MPATVSALLPASLPYGFLLLLVYSFLGWCGEMVYCSIGQGRLCEKRGFLNGPLCPIYGHGALLVLWALHGGCASPVLTFFFGLLLTSAVEYVTSFAMEKLFHMRWWDYSKHRFNLNGRVCLLNSTLFGLACVLLCHAVHPLLSRLVLALLATKAGLPLTAALLAVYLTDIVLSVRSAIHISVSLQKLHALQAELEEAVAAVKERAGERRVEAVQALREKLDDAGGELAARLDAVKADAQQRLHTYYKKLDFFDRRMVRSFPSLRSIHHGDVLDRLREYWENRKH